MSFPKRHTGGTRTKINIGCGPNGQIAGFDNLDNSPSVLINKLPFLKRLLFRIGIVSEQQYEADWSGVIRCDASKRLPYADGSVDKIYSSHFLEHVPQKMAIGVLRECFRVLKRDGVFRLIVPDLLYHAEKYVDRTRELLNFSDLPDDRDAHDSFLKTIYGAYLNKKRYGALHYYMYDVPSLVSILKSVGFTNVRKCKFREGLDKELASHDSRPEDSLYLEIRK